MKQKLIVFLVILFYGSLFSLQTTNFTETDGIIQSDKILDVFYYNTQNDNIADNWRTDNSLSWYNEPANPSDEFTGTIDNNRWQSMGDVTLSDGIVEYSGSCSYSIDGTPTNGALYSQGKWNFSGDFNIQISYSDFVADNGSGIRLEIKDDGLPQNYFLFVERVVQNDGTHQYCRNDHNNNFASVNTAATEGRLRIERSGTNVTTYYGYWDEGSGVDEDRWKWTTIGSALNFGDHDIYVKIFTVGTDNEKSVAVDVDNFIASFSAGSCNFTNLGSNSRSTTKAFPEQTILVATDKGLDIIDASDNTLWMRFKNYDKDRNDAEDQNMVVDTLNTIFALNGRIYCGAYEGYMAGLGVIDFTQDKCWFYDSHIEDGTGWDCLADISERNMHRGWTDNSSTYTQIQSYEVYDISVKVIDDGRAEKTFVALGQGVSEGGSNSSVCVVNIDDNSASYDIIQGYSDPVISVDFGINDYLYYMTRSRLHNSYTDYQNSGEFVPDNSVSIATPTDRVGAELVTSDANLFIAEKDIITPLNSGSATRRALSDFSIQTTYNVSPSSILWGSSSCSALATNNNALFIATNHSSEGRIYVVGLTAPDDDQVRGEFNYPSILSSPDIAGITFGSATDEENLFVFYGNNSGLTRIVGNDAELTMQEPFEGEIRHQFTDGNAFTYDFANVTLTLDPADARAEYGEIAVTLYNDAPNVQNPDNAIESWFEIEAETGFDALPLDVRFEIDETIAPVGSDNLILFSSETALPGSWTTHNEDPEVTVTEWHYDEQPYYVDFQTNHFSAWGTSNGSGDTPLPVTLSNFYVELHENPILHWITESETENACWNIYRSMSTDLENALWLNNNEVIVGHGTTTMSSEYEYMDNYPIQGGVTYWYWLESIDLTGNSEHFGPIQLNIPEGGGNDDPPTIPYEFGLFQNYPNPFNPNTNIRFTLKNDSFCKLTIFNIKGEKVYTLFDGLASKNQIYNCVWNGKDENAKNVGNGIYFYRIETDNFISTKKMLMIK